jgi:hypothetical protein
MPKTTKTKAVSSRSKLTEESKLYSKLVKNRDLKKPTRTNLESQKIAQKTGHFTFLLSLSIILFAGLVFGMVLGKTKEDKPTYTFQSQSSSSSTYSSESEQIQQVKLPATGKKAESTDTAEINLKISPLVPYTHFTNYTRFCLKLN